MKCLRIALLFLFIFPGFLGSALAKGPKQECKALKKQLESLQKQKETALTERASLKADLQQVQKQYEAQRKAFARERGCSKGNPNNTARCKEVLTNLHNSGAAMTRLQEKITATGRRRIALEHQIIEVQNQASLKHCP